MAIRRSFRSFVEFAYRIAVVGIKVDVFEGLFVNIIDASICIVRIGLIRRRTTCFVIDDIFGC